MADIPDVVYLDLDLDWNADYSRGVWSDSQVMKSDVEYVKMTPEIAALMTSTGLTMTELLQAALELARKHDPEVVHVDDKYWITQPYIVRRRCVHCSLTTRIKSAISAQECIERGEGLPPAGQQTN